MSNDLDKKSLPLGTTLAALGCALLQGLPNQAQAGELENWDVDAAVLVYSESDSRVQAAEPVISATRNFDSETQLNLKLVLDTLTGASPNGALPSNQPQTFTRPSGKGSYTTDAGELPLDDTFRDTRVAASADWSAPINRDWTYSVGGHFSSEHDYLSTGTNASLSRYLNQKNTTLTLAGGLSLDSISPEGGLPVGLSSMAVPGSGSFNSDFAASRSGSEDDKLVTDLLFGVTQVINRRTLMQFNYSLNRADGYLNDPYKVVSVLDQPGGTTQGYRYEQRPDSRIKQALFGQVKYQLGSGDVADLSYRYQFDDWGLNSHTLEFKYRWDLGRHYLEPQLRWYTQSAVDFYQPYALTSQVNGGLDEVTADYRLGDFDAWTLGVRYGYQVTEGQEAYTRLSLYQQTTDDFSSSTTPASGDDLPDTTAVMWILGYKF
ncbi:DUF3570 domain-containing protein [Marinospirillum perlucidum]|uniref:DUF3570 domain-containing protein n=1 Tax=Marinospirillum perlucidum TaxID=1982602 RepID=UPI000DF4C0F1|nr:DUF3570 domain-containing protein [Marinospirillum perlucidum]